MQNRDTVTSLLVHGMAFLSDVSETPRLDAEILLAFSLEKNRVWLRAWPDESIEKSYVHVFSNYLARRRGGEPIAYIVGSREFWSLEMAVTPDTLIPRPETELLVEQVLALAGEFASPCVIDAGTGSGAIAIALALELTGAEVLAVDRSMAALKVARLNARRHHAPVTFILSDWLSALASESVHIVVSNPPYIDVDDPHLKQGDVRFEPKSALVSDNHGLADIEMLCSQAYRVLIPGGVFLVEHGWRQGEAVRDLFQRAKFRDVILMRDYADNERVTIGRK